MWYVYCVKCITSMDLCQLLFLVLIRDGRVCVLIMTRLTLIKRIKAFPIALCWKFGLTVLASDSPSSSYRWWIVVVWFRIEAIAALLPEEAITFVRVVDWFLILMPHFHAFLKVTFCGEVKLWKRARADIFVLHLRAKHHLCHYITAHNDFTDEQHKILPAEICKIF